MNTTIKAVGRLLFSVATYVCLAQKKPINFVLGQYAAQTPGTSHRIRGFGSDYNANYKFNLFFGTRENIATDF